MTSNVPGIVILETTKDERKKLIIIVGLLVNRVGVKGTNGRQKTYEIFHVYCIFYSGFMCQTTVIFGITKDGSLVYHEIVSLAETSFKMALTICQNV